MTTCKLALFTWAYVGKKGTPKVVSPICPDHGSESIHVLEANNGSGLTVVCDGQGKDHWSVSLSKEEFEDERDKAQRYLETF